MSDSPIRVAIVGAGPSGFYAAGHLFAQSEGPVEVDLFDRLPTPFGLVRAGVAPDHPKIKSVTRVYEKTAAKDGFRFFGGVEIGDEITHEDLADRYHAVIYTYGASGDRKLGIEGEDLAGSWAATEFVAWYNGHPDYKDFEFDLSCERAIVVGNGNVAMDVARMLVLPREELDVTDTADHAIEALAESNVKEVVILGRRGHAQAAFTNPELLELGELTDADVVVDDFELSVDCAQSIEGDGQGTARKNVEIMKQFAGKPIEGKPKRVVLEFLGSPVKINDDGNGNVASVDVVKNELDYSGGRASAKATDDVETIECGLVFRSIGYRGIPIKGLPFDEQGGVIHNDAGRVIDDSTGEHLKGVYVSGWIKRGPTGVIGTNKRDAQETVDQVLADAAAGDLPEPTIAGDIEDLLDEKGIKHVTWEEWKQIDEAEVAAGEQYGKPRKKFVDIDEMRSATRS